MNRGLWIAITLLLFGCGCAAAAEETVLEDGAQIAPVCLELAALPTHEETKDGWCDDGECRYCATNCGCRSGGCGTIMKKCCSLTDQCYGWLQLDCQDRPYVCGDGHGPDCPSWALAGDMIFPPATETPSTD